MIAKDAGDGAVPCSGSGDTTKIKVFCLNNKLFYDTLTFGLI